MGGEFFRVLQGRPGKCLLEADTRFYAAEVVCGTFLSIHGFLNRNTCSFGIFAFKRVYLSRFEARGICFVDFPH